jgi:hypothetical protein
MLVKQNWLTVVATLGAVAFVVVVVVMVAVIVVGVVLKVTNEGTVRAVDTAATVSTIQ